MKGKFKHERWMFPLLLAALHILGMHIRDSVLPPGHWSGVLVADVLPPPLAALAMLLYLRRAGRSQEARFELAWLNARRLMIEAPRVPDVEIRCSPLLKWLITAMGALLTVLLLWLRFCVALDQQVGIEFALPLIAFFALATVLFWVLASRPAMRIGPDGLSGVMGRVVLWEQIGTCRIQTKRNAWGNVSAPQVSVRGKDGRQIAFFSLNDTPRGERLDFLLALHFALLPHEEAPIVELEQVLAGRSGQS